MNPFQFLPKDPVIWRGHYERIPGDTTTFHCDINGKVFVRWDDLETGDQLTSKGLEFGDVGELGEAVNEIKFQFNGKGGGSFLINEFGNVIVPTSDGHVRYHVGDVEGHIYFKDPDSNRFFTLDSTSEHQRGDLWERPYVGNMYHQSPDGRIFRNLEYDDVIEKQYLNGDPNIAEDLVAVRGTNGCRFIVNCHGVVLTKVQGPYGWEPCYVGKIDFQEWYQDGLSNYGSKARQSNNEHPTTSSAVWPPIQETSDTESGYVSKKEDEEVDQASDHEYWDFDEDDPEEEDDDEYWDFDEDEEEEGEDEDEDHNEDDPEEESDNESGYVSKKEDGEVDQASDHEYWDFDEDEDEEKNENEGLDNKGEGDEEEDWDDDPYSLNSEDDGPENIDLDNDFDPYQ